MSFQPITAALAAAALLSACVAPVAYNDQVEKSATYQKLDAPLKGEVAPDPAQIEQLQNLVRLTLANNVLFADGGWQLNESGKAALSTLAPALKDLSGQRIVIKGFTDNLPVGATLPERLSGNVELSKARAQAVASLLVEQGVPKNIVSITGLGETHPVADNDTPQGRAKNRRVEIDIVEAPA